jgi:hypothetical protein
MPKTACKGRRVGQSGIFSALEGSYINAAGRRRKKGFLMKNKIKLVGLIALVVVFGLLMAGCGKIDKDLEGTWEFDAAGEYLDGLFTIKIASDEFSVGSEKLADSVKKEGSDKLRLKKGSDDIGTYKYKLDGDTLELKEGSNAALKVFEGTYKRKK